MRANASGNGGPTKRLVSTLFGQTRRRVLGLLLGRPDEAFYVREIVRATGSAQGAVQRELLQLEAAGILDRHAKGHQVFYRANPQCPVFAELQSIVMKTTGLVEVLRRSLEPLRDSIRLAFVFGSMAKKHDMSSSDVDLFVVGNVSFGDLVETLADAQAKLGREVSPVVESPDEFRKRVEHRDHFVSTVLRETKMFVIGDTNELARLGAERLAGAAHDEPAGNR